MAQTTKTLRMVFKNQAGGNYTLSLDDPRDDLIDDEILTFMDMLIGANIITTAGGDLVSKQDIKIIGQTIDDLYDPV